MKNNMRVYYCQGMPPQISQHCLAYLLLETMLNRDYSGKLLKKPKYGRTQQGKPYLKNCPWVQFNISHCREGVACAIGSVPVGIDMERRFPWKENLARRICHPEEWKKLEQMEKDAQREQFLNLLWSRKESLLKCIGIGIRCDMREINTLEVGMHRYCELQKEQFTLVACCETEEKEEIEIERVRGQDLLS